MNASVLEILKKSAAVPSMPQVVLRFLEIMQDPNFEYADLVKVLSTDPGTVSEVLRLANSALFGVRNKVVSLRQGLTLLGPKRTRSLLLGRYLVDSMSSKQASDLDMSYYWRRSLTASVVASHLAGVVPSVEREEGFVGALLAKIGIPILAEAFPRQYGLLVARFTPHGIPVTSEEELKAVEVTHAQVSAMVLSHWTLPTSVCTAVNMHLSETPGEGPSAALSRVINASHRIAKLLCETSEAGEAGDICAEAVAFCGTGLDLLLDLLPTIENEIEELAGALRVTIIPSNVYALIAKTLKERLVVPVGSG